ncbi:FAD/NAD(P)-binding protein [Salinisphaera sp. Q1T1-3]|uniref:FAD/NAD(P)-binding protein n=1 Tax=Salinisphaera sp. Q1T1-3 TaxID=2321229 RepID=UPI001F465289|nr:FAD/NAD(P)-binding protein [Salinisphaera sp. Q1T1-3]
MAQPQRRVLVLEREAFFGPAYRHPGPMHQLNTPAVRMTACPDRPQEFVEFVRRLGHDVDDRDFLPRAWYRHYLADCLAAARRAGLQVRLDEAMAIEPGSSPEYWQVRCRSGQVPWARHVVLAVGAERPRTPVAMRDAADHPGYHADPWAPGAWHVAATQRDDPIVLIGTGQTAMDGIIELDRQGHRGPIIAVSRRGLVPAAHAPVAADASLQAAPAPVSDWPLHSAVALMKAVRARMQTTGDWRRVSDELRAQADAIWQALDPRIRARLLRHARPYWDICRHRLAPEVARRVERLRASGRLRIVAARLLACDPAPDDRLALTLRPRAGAEGSSLSAARVVNCTGLVTDPNHPDTALLRQLLATGRATVAPHRLGLKPLAARLHVLGVRSRGDVWEHTAVPELAIDVDRLVRRIVASFRSEAV